jgi:hypothetical protein
MLKINQNKILEAEEDHLIDLKVILVVIIVKKICKKISKLKKMEKYKILQAKK